MSSNKEAETPSVRFIDLGLSDAVTRVLIDVGYEVPSPIQAATIPHLLEGRDVLGQAQTGTGKTAAFALPILSRIDLEQRPPQALVLAPTRELAIQVAEAFQRYAQHLPGFHVLPIYGGQSYEPQLKALKRGVHVVVGTPGRIVDHIRRGTLQLDALRTLVLDEADEMLRMGFVDDVETVLKQTPPSRQIALFSATMPSAIRRIAQTYQNNPTEITIRSSTSTAASIRQRYWMVGGVNKLDALTRILEAEPFDGMIIFARTRLAVSDLAERLQARGFAAAPMHGDIDQKQRERTVTRLRDGQLDILVATDVAARGLDVERVSHVLNFDIPTDTEAYVHRIGRTGRAGRSGEAILFVTSRERHLLRAIERATRQPIEPMSLPTADVINDQRVQRFRQRIDEALAADDLDLFRNVVAGYEADRGVQMSDIAAALARMAQGDTPLLLPPETSAPAARPERAQGRPEKPARAAREGRDNKVPRDRPVRDTGPRAPEPGMETFRIEVGHAHKVKPGSIVGAIANEAGLDGKLIGRIEIHDDHSTVDLPEGMPDDIFKDLQNTRVAGRPLRIRRLGPGDQGRS
jgi:ATP-dependent RNA helicase DeaD